MSSPNPMMAMLFILILLASACSKSDEEECTNCVTTTADARPTPLAQDLSPLPGDGPMFSTPTATGYTVSWTAATDHVTKAAELEYQLIRADRGEEIDSLSEAVNLSGSAEQVMDWTSAVLSKTIVDAAPQPYSYAVLVRDEVGNIALYPPQELFPDSPDAGTDITFADVTESSLTVSWGAANSATTAPENLEYRVVRAAAVTAVDSFAEVLAASTVVLDWTKNTNSIQLSGLTGNTTIAIAVLVRDMNDRIAIYAPASIKTASYRVIFKTSTEFSSTQLTPSTNADALCNADLAKPAGRGTFKALISGPDRLACTTANCSTGPSEHLDWVMEANRTYENRSGETLWTTNADGIVLSNVTHPAIYINSNQFIWTGIEENWTKSPANCMDWSTNASNVLGRIGTANATTSSAFTSFHQACNNLSAIYCVEQ